MLHHCPVIKDNCQIALCYYLLIAELDKSISGLVAEYIVAIDVTRVRFPADALLLLFVLPCVLCRCKAWGYTIFYVSGLAAELEFFRKHQQELADPQSLNHTHHAPGCGWINVTPLCGDQRHLPNRIVLPPANC